MRSHPWRLGSPPQAAFVFIPAQGARRPKPSRFGGRDGRLTCPLTRLKPGSNSTPPPPRFELRTDPTGALTVPRPKASLRRGFLGRPASMAAFTSIMESRTQRGSDYGEAISHSRRRLLLRRTLRAFGPGGDQSRQPAWLPIWWWPTRGSLAMSTWSPVDQVVETDADRIQLSCAAADLKAMRPFLRGEHVPGEVPFIGYDPGEYTLWPSRAARTRACCWRTTTTCRPATWQSGAARAVVAADGPVGRVDEFIVDPATTKSLTLSCARVTFGGRGPSPSPVADRAHGRGGGHAQADEGGNRRLAGDTALTAPAAGGQVTEEPQTAGTRSNLATSQLGKRRNHIGTQCDQPGTDPGNTHRSRLFVVPDLRVDDLVPGQQLLPGRVQRLGPHPSTGSRARPRPSCSS